MLSHVTSHTTSELLALTSHLLHSSLSLSLPSSHSDLSCSIFHDKQLFFTAPVLLLPLLRYLASTHAPRYASSFSSFSVALNYILASIQLFSYYSNFFACIYSHLLALVFYPRLVVVALALLLLLLLMNLLFLLISDAMVFATACLGTTNRTGIISTSASVGSAAAAATSAAIVGTETTRLHFFTVVVHGCRPGRALTVVAVPTSRGQCLMVSSRPLPPTAGPSSTQSF